ncbi:MAG: PDZ domain-containing protein [Actinobacteria bacterium]|jgi:S1-C subfamily serine protease|nr:PDZ domain-containing protein [Actinomycetota bacterium]NCV42593.1 PDZ domain-containing protein [Actinomycetota bacterium]NCV81910.1 PDZ domain-containing protein [Actinomycetota bacterium]NCW43076.1 PDZ domain-containing protein [Actinomycetota bacterium]NCW72015.1 PDZ domain-containing protein [Actinomycetota bacterium]
MKSTIAKIGFGFLLGATAIAGVATAANSEPIGVKACVDKKTQVMYLAANDKCISSRTLVSLGASSIDVKSIAALVTPSVVSIKVTAPSGSGSGSGSIYKTNSTSSYIITNNHVVDSAAIGGSILVEFINGDTVAATIVGRDSNYDLAVLKVEKGNLPTIKIGNSSNISVGDPVVAIGSPLGLASTVTSGIISAKNRPVTTGTSGAESYVNAIQTDAAINPGNSGGALLDSAGRIIGVNSAIATLSSGGVSGSIGLGFSIPINEAKRIVDELIATGKSTRPVLGIFFDTTYAGVGAKISRLSPGDPAEKAGIPAGSIIKSIDGVKIADQVGAIVRIRSYAPGATVTVVVELPSGMTQSFKVVLGSAPSN